MFMDILDHHDGCINHRANGNGNSAQRHDIRIDPLKAHDDERRQHPEWQSDDRHQCRARMPQEQRANDADDDEFLDQLGGQVADRCINQL